MLTGVLVTDGGAHAPEDWAMMTAQMIIDAFTVKDNSPNRSQIEMAKERAKVAIMDIMIGHHEFVQAKERELLAAGDHGRLKMFDIDLAEHTDIENAIAEIRVAVKPILDSISKIKLVPGEAHMGENLAQFSIEDHLMNVIRQRVECDLKTVIHIERSWHADKHPDHPTSVAFKAYTDRAGRPWDWHPSINPAAAE